MLTINLADRIDELAGYLKGAGREADTEASHRETMRAVANCKPTTDYSENKRLKQVELRARLGLSACLRQQGELAEALETLKPFENKGLVSSEAYALAEELARCATVVAANAAQPEEERQEQAVKIRKSAAWELGTAFSGDKSLFAAADKNPDLAAVMASPDIAAVRKLFEFVAHMQFENVRFEKGGSIITPSPDSTIQFDVVNASSVELPLAANFGMYHKFLSLRAYLEPLTEPAKRLGIRGLTPTNGRYGVNSTDFAARSRALG